MASRHAVVAGRLVKMMPPVPLQRLGDDLRHPLEGARNAGENATLGTRGGSVLSGECGICAQISGRWGTCTSGHQGLSPLLEQLCIRCLAIPTFAHQGHTTLLGPQQFSNGLLQVGPMVFGIAGGEVKGALVALGDIVATAGKAGRVKMLDTWLKACLDTDSQRPLAQQQSTPLGLDCIEPPAKLNALAQLGADPGTQPPIERVVGKKLGREGPRSIGTPQAIEDHPGHRFARGDLLLRIRKEARVDHTSQASVFDHTGNEPQLIQAFHMDRCHFYPSPESSRVICRSLQRKVKDFFSCFTCSMSVYRGVPT